MTVTAVMKNLPEIETPRLILRAAKTSDAPDIAEWMSDPELYELWAANPLPLELNPLEYYSDEKNLLEPEFESLDWFIYHKADGKVIGEVEFYDIKNDYQTEMSYRISKHYRNCGYASEAAEAAVKAVFRYTDINRISVHIDTKNTASEKLIKKIGFSYEGTLRSEMFFDTVSDYKIFSALRSDNNFRK
ncbi:MAG: GNAT family N-acetyltransferase [Ruminococcus sp.]|jgi:RimJ/RimL family protein N-acetyltransferase|nr:GNAT family N-acetyltransferase [Ruminococcus sp.]